MNEVLDERERNEKERNKREREKEFYRELPWLLKWKKISSVNDIKIDFFILFSSERI